MRRLALIVGLILSLALSSSASAATLNFSQSTVDETHFFAFFVHTASDGQLGAKVTWQGAACCANGHSNGLTLTIALVDQPTDAYQEIDLHGEACSVGGSKPLSCYVLADPYTKGGIAPVGWYLVKIEQFDPVEVETNVKASVYGNIDQTAPGPTVLYP